MAKKATDNHAMTNYKRTKQLVLTALLFAVAIVLSIIEKTLPPLPIYLPGVQLGLSNIAVMYALFFIGKKQAFALAFLKAFFVFSTRGATAGGTSFLGGIFSLLIMILLMEIFKEKISYLIISISGAVFHNIGQFVLIALILGYSWAYLFILLISGVVAGVATATLLKFIFPAFKKVGLK